jgi:ferredoxin
MRAEINRELCQGHGVCQATAPEVFEVSPDDGISVVVSDQIRVELEPTIRLAAENCPEAAIRLL